MKIAALISRILLGLMFLVFGLNGILHFIPTPPMPPSLMKDFATVLEASHFTVVISAIEVVCAILFLVNRFVPLALTLLGPILVNILLFHIFLAPASIGPGVFATVLWFILFYRERDAFAGIFRAKA
jgi:putative oxidoreductase